MKFIYSILSKYFIHGIIIIILGFVFAGLFNILDIDKNETGIILTFVGVLATFVVVSNFAQVKSIENSFDKKISEIKEKTSNNILGTVLYNLGMFYSQPSIIDYNIVLTSYIKSLHFIKEAGDDLVGYRECIDSLTASFDDIVKNKIEIYFNEGTKQEYIKLLKNINDVKLNKIIDYIEKSKSI